LHRRFGLFELGLELVGLAPLFLLPSLLFIIFRNFCKDSIYIIANR
jgi:hypothetical protein